jgi:hypothetical protein
LIATGEPNRPPIGRVRTSLCSSAFVVEVGFLLRDGTFTVSAYILSELVVVAASLRFDVNDE